MPVQDGGKTGTRTPEMPGWLNTFQATDDTDPLYGRPHGALPFRLRTWTALGCSPRGPRHFIHTIFKGSSRRQVGPDPRPHVPVAQNCLISDSHFPRSPANPARAPPRPRRLVISFSPASRIPVELEVEGGLGHPEIPMVQLPGSGKRRAEPAPAPAVKLEAAAPAVKLEAEAAEGFGGGDGLPPKRVKAVPPPSPLQVDRPLPPFIILYILSSRRGFCSVYGSR